MHEGETAVAINAGYAPVGESGAYSTIPFGTAGPGLGREPFYGNYQSIGSSMSGDIAGADVLRYVGNNGSAQYTGAQISAQSLEVSNFMLVAAAYDNSSYMPNSAAAAYGIPTMPGMMPPSIIPNRTPISEGGIQMQARDIGYRTQEVLGIYGFGFGAVRSALGFGDQDFTPRSPVLQEASAAYGSTRAFWNLNIGGIGDAPSETLNLNVSEVIRRFIPKERTGTSIINPIPNTMAAEHPWLPGSDYYLDFKRGDPFTKVSEGEIRLPGQAYERLNNLHSDATGRYGMVDQHKILGDIAPYSKQYKALNASIDGYDLSPIDQLTVERTRQQVKRVVRKNEFNEYSAKYDPSATMGQRLVERALHMDSIVTRKLGRHSSAVEDWERNNVYGPTFQQWQAPIDTFLKPMVYESTQSNPLASAGSLGLALGFFGKTPTARLTAASVGIATGAAAGAYGAMYKAITGDRFMPKERKEQAALEEYTDVLTYTKNKRLQSMALEAGDSLAASSFDQAAKRTMYGIDLVNASIQDVLAAIPKRKREHFESFLNAPSQEREQILSTAPRLERRILQAAWGERVEALPALEDIFESRELPGAGWEGWHPNTNMDHIKIKAGQHMGLDLSQMGYYPQQIQQANLVNPTFPVFGFEEDSRTVRARLESLMTDMGIQGSVIQSPTPFSGVGLQINQGVFG
jgi:hypothetical protein